jgi:hypothetical protein
MTKLHDHEALLRDTPAADAKIEVIFNDGRIQSERVYLAQAGA